MKTEVPHILIKSDGCFSDIYVDGKKIEGVRKISFLHETGVNNNIPIISVEFPARDVVLDCRLAPSLPDFYKPFYEPISLGADCQMGQSDAEQQ